MKGMKKTNYKVCVGKDHGTDVYRTLWIAEDGRRYFKDEGKIWCMEDMPHMEEHVIESWMVSN